MKKASQKTRIAREIFCCNLAESYHENIKSLYTSKYAWINRHLGASEQSEFLYSKSYGFPARWKNAGWYIEKRKIIIENHLGKRVLSFPLPALPDLKKYSFDGLLDGDLYAKPVHFGVIERFDAQGKSTGFAAKLMRLDGTRYWEHGTTIRAMRAEFLHKIEVEAARAAEREKTRAQQRALSLARHLVKNVHFSYEDARAMGYCNPGIQAFCDRYGINPDQGADLSTLKNIEDRRVSHLITRKLTQCVNARLS